MAKKGGKIGDEKRSGYTADITVKVRTDVESPESGELPHLYRIYWIDDKAAAIALAALKKSAIQAIDDSDASALEIIKKHKIKEDVLCWGAEVSNDQLEIDIRVGEKRIQVDQCDNGTWEDRGLDDTEERNYLGTEDMPLGLGETVFEGIVPPSESSDSNQLVIDKAPVLSMAMKTSIEVDSDDVTAADFKLSAMIIDDQSIYRDIFYLATDIETDLRGVVYQGRNYPLSVEYETGPSRVRFYSPVSGVWEELWEPY